MPSRDDSDPALLPTVSVTPRDAATAATAPAAGEPGTSLAVGERLADRYLVTAFLGEGGMGAVYRAVDEKLGEDVALKLVRGTAYADTLREEVRLAQKVTHVNVCRTYDLEDAGDHHFIKMEYVAGETLAARLRREGKLAIADAVRIARDIADGLAAAHARGIAHRDLKPGNVMLSGDRTVLMDFGIAHVIANGRSATAGTLGYMAPEQLTESPADGRADLYALGCVLYEMLAGEPVFGDARKLELAIRHASMRPPDVRAKRPEVPRWLARAVRELLAKLPERRETGVARLRAGARSPLRVAVPLGAAAVVLAAVAAWQVLRPPSWRPAITSYEVYEESGSVTSISPDGAWLVFDSDRVEHASSRLYVMNRATGATTPLATQPGLGVVAPRWTRDGKALLYEAGVPGGDHVYRQRVAGTPPALVGSPEDLGIGITPDACGDDAIVYVDSGPVTQSLVLLAADGTRTTLVTVQHKQNLHMPRCDPSGEHVVFVRGTALEWESGNDVLVADRGGTVRQLTSDHSVSSATFASDGRSIVFAGRRGAGRDLFEMPAVGGTPRPLGLADATTISDVSRDGTLLAFHRDDTATFPVLADKGAAHKITTKRGNYFWARPAGADRIVARRADGARSDIVAIRISDGAITELAPGFTPFPSLDNTRVYFQQAGTPGVLMTVPIAGGTPTTVARLPGPILFGADGPDGVHVAVDSGAGIVEAYRVTGARADAEGAPGLVTVAPDGGWRAVTVLFAKSGDDTRSRLRLIPPGASLGEPAEELAVGSVINLWLDAHHIGYCSNDTCSVRDVTAGTSEDVPTYVGFAPHLALVTPDHRLLDSLLEARLTRHVITNFDARPR